MVTKVMQFASANIAPALNRVLKSTLGCHCPLFSTNSICFAVSVSFIGRGLPTAEMVHSRIVQKRSVILFLAIFIIKIWDAKLTKNVHGHILVENKNMRNFEKMNCILLYSANSCAVSGISLSSLVTRLHPEA